MTTKQITAFHVDTCLSDYLQDHYSRDGQFLCHATLGQTLDETVNDLHDDTIMSGEEIPESITCTEVKAALKEAISTSDLRYIDGDGNRCEERPEETDDCCEEPYLYVVLDWRDLHKDGPHTF